MLRTEIFRLKAELIAQGDLLTMKVKRQQTLPNRTPGKRGAVAGFSSGARRRMIQLMARMEKKGLRATFVTLTFHKVVHSGQAKMALKRFLARVHRRFRRTSGVWRMETQPNRGAYHFHILFFGLPYWPQCELQSVWEQCTREGRSIVDIRLVSGIRSVMGYVSKYVAKKDENAFTSLDDVTYQHAPGFDRGGRVWGIFNHDELPFAQEEGGVLVALNVVKALSEMAWSRLGFDKRYGSMSFALITPFAYELLDSALARGGLDYDEWRDSSMVSPMWYKNKNGVYSRF